MTPGSPSDMMSAVTESMKQRTGRTLDEWVSLVSASDIDPRDQKGVRSWLKNEHGVLQNSQWAIADAAARGAGWERPDVQGSIDQQYAGAKAGLRPIFDRIREIVELLGDDVQVEGRATYTPFVRRRQFVAVAAATRTRVDVGLRFVDVPKSTLLVASNAPGQATHKLSLTSVSDVNNEVERLLKIAYEQNG